MPSLRELRKQKLLEQEAKKKLEKEPEEKPKKLEKVKKIVEKLEPKKEPKAVKKSITLKEEAKEIKIHKPVMKGKRLRGMTMEIVHRTYRELARTMQNLKDLMTGIKIVECEKEGCNKTNQIELLNLTGQLIIDDVLSNFGQFCRRHASDYKVEPGIVLQETCSPEIINWIYDKKSEYVRKLRIYKEKLKSEENGTDTN